MSDAHPNPSTNDQKRDTWHRKEIQRQRQTQEQMRMQSASDMVYHRQLMEDRLKNIKLQGDFRKIINKYSQIPQDYKEYVILHIYSYDKQSARMSILHNILQLIIFIGAAVVTILIGITDVPKIIPAIISGIVTTATVIANYYKFGERSRTLYLTAEALALEYNRFDSKRGLYKDLGTEEALALFMDRVEALMKELTERTIALEKVKENAK
jgi:hypothetical protein